MATQPITLDYIPAKLRHGQPRQLTEYLIQYGVSTTPELQQRLAIGNISEAARSANHVALEKYGLRIVAKPPTKKILNRFGEPTRLHTWHVDFSPERCPNSLELIEKAYRQKEQYFGKEGIVA